MAAESRSGAGRLTRTRSARWRCGDRDSLPERMVLDDGFRCQMQTAVEELMSNRDKEKTKRVMKTRRQIGKLHMQNLMNDAATSCLA